MRTIGRRSAALGVLLLGVAIQEAGAQQRVSPKEVGKADQVTSFGATRAYFRVSQPGPVVLPLNAREYPLLEPDSLRAYRLRSDGWELISDSRYDGQREALMLQAPQEGIYSAFGASRVDEIYSALRVGCQAGRGRDLLPDICTKILCDGGDFEAVAGSVAGGLPFAADRGPLLRQMGDICGQCLHQPSPAPSFPECDLPHFTRPEFPRDRLLPWPFRPWCVERSTRCVPGGYAVGRGDYNFEDEFDLVPSGSSVPAYAGVDVRATVRYPAAAAGVGQPMAGSGRYPLVVFLHGNHATCPCSCSHSCDPAERIPSHLGYTYLLDLLASWGFIAVSIDGFDVTCAGSYLMSDYEARGRLVLRHLDKWKGWDSAGGDPWDGLFRNHVDMARIGLSGHSRGGEGVVAAEFINRAESLGFQIKAVNAIAPTDQDPAIRYIPKVPYFLLLGASDGDVSNLQGLRTYDRTSLAGVSDQSDKSLAWVHGANHNFFNTVWTPGTGFACAGDDGTGEGRLTDSLQRLVACQTIVPFFRLHLQGVTQYRKLFQGERADEGLEGVRMYWAYQDSFRREVDSFDTGDDRNTNSLGGAVSTSGGLVPFDEYEFKHGGADTYDASFYHFTHGLVLGWGSPQTYRTTLPPGQRDVSSYTVLAVRASQVLDGGVLNRADTPRTLRMSLRTGAGEVSNLDFDTAGLLSVPYPYEGNGGKTVLTTIRFPLSGFRRGNTPLPLTDIESVALEFLGTGLLAIDDIQFSR